MAVDLDQIAERTRQWQDKNFKMDAVLGALVLCEESGEVARAVGKKAVGIRPGTRGDVGEEIGDVLLTAIALADRHGLSAERCMMERFNRLATLDFTIDVEGGRPMPTE
jgi:NTP pyrophosphatase (non-canonical NTP hydrolase)